MAGLRLLCFIIIISSYEAGLQPTTAATTTTKPTTTTTTTTTTKPTTTTTTKPTTTTTKPTTTTTTTTTTTLPPPTVTSIEKLPPDGGPFIHVTVGQAGVWAINNKNQIYYRMGTYGNNLSKGSYWVLRQGNGNMIDAGYNGAAYTYKGSYLWEIYRISANNQLGYLSYFTNNVKEVAYVNPYGLWAVDGTEGNPWLFTTTSRWDKVTGVYLNQISAGEAGVWGISSNNEVYYREGTAGGNALWRGTNWKRVYGSMMNVASGSDVVLAIRWDNNVYRRAVNSQKPTGVWWTQVIGPSSSTGLKLDQVDTFGKVAWGVYKGEVYFIKL